MADPVLHAGIAHGQAVLTLLPALARTQGPRYRKHMVAPSVLYAHVLKPFLPWMHLGDLCTLCLASRHPALPVHAISTSVAHALQHLRSSKPSPFLYLSSLCFQGLVCVVITRGQQREPGTRDALTWEQLCLTSRKME